MDASIDDILDFWYSEGVKKQWFNASKALDDKIRRRYQKVWEGALDDKYDLWMSSAEGSLALAIVLDQFPLNMFRRQKSAFAGLDKAIAISRIAITKNFPEYLEKSQLSFLFMPLMHSEEMVDQNLSIKMFEQYGLKNNLRFAHHHRSIVERFGRFPHRNAILGRDSRPEEIEYLNSPEAFKG